MHFSAQTRTRFLFQIATVLSLISWASKYVEFLGNLLIPSESLQNVEMNEVSM